MTRGALLGLTVIAALLLPGRAPRAQQEVPSTPQEFALQPTRHPQIPPDVSLLWLAPTARTVRTPAMTTLASAVKLELDSNFARALPLLSDSTVGQGTLGAYATYYRGLAELRLARTADARRTFQSLTPATTTPDSYIYEAAALREAECDEALGDNEAALGVYERLAAAKTLAPDEVLMRLGHAARVTGHLDRATEAFTRVLYEFPFSDYAAQANSELANLPAPAIVPGSVRYKLELGRGERLFGAKKYGQARPVFEGLRSVAQDDDRELIALRLAECDYFLKQPRRARDGTKPFIEKAARQGEALFFYAIASRDLGETDEYLRSIRRLVQDFSDQSWAEEGLNNLATYYILQDDDAQADTTFREMYGKFPTGHYAERGAWKIGWYAFRNGSYRDAVQAFESGAAHFPRSDYRPAWLYWSARAHEALHETSIADARYALVVTDYLNTYYGRLASKRLDGRAVARLASEVQPPNPPLDVEASPSATGPSIPANAPIVRALLAIDLYDQAVDELHFAQKAWGDSPVIQATLGWIFNRRGDLRAGINAMKRAYPQYMTAGGERLPTELLKVLFPVEYWSEIRRYASDRQLDPYLIAALVLQESNFTANIKSPANAYGLMQIVPATGRQYARTLKIPKRFSISMLTTADTNLKMGTAYFSDLVQHFGGVHFALATYNAGPSRVARWIAQKPGIPQDEFIDDIPFPETQNYVKRILGTAEDYRRLYGSGGAVAETRSPATRPAVARTTAPAPVQKAGGAASTAKKPAAKAPAKRKKPATASKRKKTA
jgi:peptidoglycan lytic transglycosylase